MKSFAVVALASLTFLATTSTDAAVVVAKDCTQSERQLVNKLLLQDVNPAKACYAKAKGDITTLSTSRLCPIAECATWLEYMSENAPNCVYDDTNYGTSFKAKAKDCSSSSSGSVASDSDLSKATTKTPSTSASSTAGSSAEAGVVTKTKAPVTSGGSKSSSSGSSGSSDEDTTIEVPIIDNSTLTKPPTTPKPTTIAPVTPTPTKSAASSTFTGAVGALCAVSLSLAVLAF